MRDDETPTSSGERMPTEETPPVPKPLKQFGIPPTREVREFEEIIAEVRAKYPDSPPESWELLRDTMEAHSSRPLFRDSEERRKYD